MLERQCLFHHAIDISTTEPFVSELRPAMEIYGRDDAHVCLTPLTTAVRNLGFEQFEGVEAKLGLWDFECPSKDGAGFVLN